MADPAFTSRAVRLKQNPHSPFKKKHIRIAQFLCALTVSCFWRANFFLPTTSLQLSDQTMLRLGIVDLDSSHSVEFSRRFNHAGVDREQWVEGAQVVAAWSGGSMMAPERVAGFQAELESIGIPIVDSREQLMERIDGVLILSIATSNEHGRSSPQEFRPSSTSLSHVRSATPERSSNSLNRIKQRC